MKNDSFIGVGGKRLTRYTWEISEPKAVLIIVHGMAEHMGRYDDFAKHMNTAGFIVTGVDLRGHGKTDKETLGYCEGEMWKDSVKDITLLIKDMKNQYGLPVAVMGHSYGSFLTQTLIEENAGADMYVLSGSCYMKSAEVPLGKTIASISERNKGEKYPLKVIYDMSFGSYNKKFGGEAAWLSRDKEMVDKYKADVMCGFCCSAHFYKCFFTGLSGLYGKTALSRLDKKVPIYIFSGSVDPVGKNGNGVKKLYDFYSKGGVQNVNMMLYTNGRHEMLNELDRNQVYEDVATAMRNGLKLE